MGSIILFRQKSCKFTHFFKKTHKSKKYSQAHAKKDFADKKKNAKILALPKVDNFIKMHNIFTGSG